MVAMKHGKIYTILSVEKGWYRIMSEIGESYLFPSEAFEVIDKRD